MPLRLRTSHWKPPDMSIERESARAADVGQFFPQSLQDSVDAIAEALGEQQAAGSVFPTALRNVRGRPRSSCAGSAGGLDGVRIADRGWTIEGVPIRLPISIETAMDVDHVKKYFSLKAGAVQRVDRLVR
jgi:hypothetical protein